MLTPAENYTPVENFPPVSTMSAVNLPPVSKTMVVNSLYFHWTYLFYSGRICSTAACASHGCVCCTADCVAWTSLSYRSLCWPGHFWSTTACDAPGCVFSIEVCAVFGHVYNTAAWAASGRTCLKQPVLPMEVLYIIYSRLCFLDVSVLHQTALPLDVSVIQKVTEGANSRTT